MAEDNKTLTEIQNAQAAVNTPPTESAPPAVAPPTPATEATAPVTTSPTQAQGNEGTHGLVDPNAPQEQAQPDPNADPNADPAIAAAPEDGFDPDEVVTAAGGAAGGGGGGGSAAFGAYDPGSLSGGRGALDLLGALDLTTTPLSGLPGVGGGTPDDGVSGRSTSDFLSGSGIGFERSPYDLQGNPLLEGAPNANVGDYTQQATQLTLTFTPLNGASLLSVSITLPEGIGLSINGAAPVYGTITVPADQIGNLVLITPPYSDANFQISVTPTMTDRFGGLHTLAPITADVVIDAVAQRPEDVAGTLVDDGNASHVMTETVTKSDGFVDGKDVTEQTVTTTTTEGRVNVSLNVTATFQDFDGSEQHFALVEKLPGFEGAYNTIEINGVTYFQVPVTNADLIANNGTVTIPVSLTAPQTTTDTDFSVRTGAMATETPSDSELRLDNNVATVIDPTTVDFKIDVINSTLTVETGWASEGEAPDKNMASGTHDAEWTNGDVHEATTNGDAPITLSIAGGEGSTEVIDSVTFTYDASRGTLDYTGPGTATPGTDANGNATLTITGINSPNLTDLVFKPTTTTDAQYNSDDVKLDYKVTVTNDKGASATFSGSSTVVIDAVADLPTNVDTGVAYDGNAANTAADWGSAIDVKVTANFSDYKDGSENHYMLVEAREGWSCSNADGTVVLNGVTYFYKEASALDLQNANGAGEFTFKLTAPEKGSSSADAQTIAQDGSITLKSGSLAVEGKIEGTQNGQVVPSGEDREWDLGNNVAFAGKDTTINFNVINSEASSAAKAAYEDHQSDPAQQGNANPTGTDGNIILSLPVTGGEHITDVTLTFNFAGTQPGTFTYDGNTYTPQMIDGKWTVTLPASAVQAAGDDTSVTLRYNPPANDDTDLTNLNYSMNVAADNSSATGTHTGSITSNGTSTTGTLIVDAVADRSGDITSKISADGSNQGNALTDHGAAVTVDANRTNSPATSGWETDSFSAGAQYAAQTHSLVVSVKTSFPDHDGSETHTLLVQKPATGTWNVDTASLPAGYSLVVDGAGNPVLYTGSDGNKYFQIKVDASGTPGNGYDGNAAADITLKATGISGDLNTTIKTGAISQEGAQAATEITLDNNTAARIDGSAPNYVIDVINSTLTVKTGWASEGNAPDQNMASGKHTPNWISGTNASAATSADGAPVQISISGNSGTTGTTNEYISSITISHTGGAEGNLVYQGTVLDTSTGTTSWSIGGNTVTYDATSGKFTITFGNTTTTSLGNDLVYRPNANSDSDTDVKLDYSVTVKNGAGAEATFNGASTVVIDAAADRPDVKLDADMNKVVDYQTDPVSGQEQTAARPGENVKVNIESVKFGDYKDGSESHYITLNKNLTNPTTGANIATTSIATGQTITLTGKDANGDTVTQTVVFGDSAAHSTITITKADGTFTTRTMTGPEYNAMANSADGYSNFKIPVLNEFLQLTADGKVSTSFDIKAPSSSVNTTYEAKVGGDALEATKDGELDKGNNESWAAEKVKFDVNPVTSTPKVVINLADSKIYENDTPHANVLGNTDKGGGAKINISGIDAGETATIELTFSLKNGAELAESANPGDVMRIEYNGQDYPATFGADGKWHVTVDVAGQNNGDAADGVLTFKPGSNYNSSDIHVDYKITVKDDASGQTGKMVDGKVVGDDANPWQNSDNSSGKTGYQAENKDLGILVDAVAQAPEFGEKGVTPDYAATGASEESIAKGEGAFVSGKDVALRADITFEDYLDGSEKHYMLVEAKVGWEAPTSIKILGSDGQWHDVPLNVTKQIYTDPATGEKTMYYKLEIPNEMIQQYGTDGKIDAQIWMKSPASAGDTEFKVGAIANEDASKFNNTTNVDFDKGNNTSIVIKETPVKIHFDNATGAKLSIGNTYEDLNSQQNTTAGQSHKDNPGSIVFASNASGDDEVLTEVSISFKNPDGTVTLPGGITIDSAGTIIAPAGYNVDTDANGKTTITKDGSNSSIEITKGTDGTTNVTMKPGDDASLNTRLEVNYTPNANSDADFTFDYKTETKDPSSGDTAKTSGSSTVVVDAVADLPKDLDIANGKDVNGTPTFEMTHGVKIPTDGSNPQYQSIKVKVNADFGSDIKDGSEAHYILIEVTANTYVTNPDGTIMNCDIFYGPGGVRYYKVPVANSEINPDGTVSKEINLITYSRQLGVENDSTVTIRTGALAVEENPSGGELNQNNNTAFLKGESFDIVNHWPGGHTIWIDPAYENNTPHANLDDPNQAGTQPNESTPKDGEFNGKMYFGTVVEGGPAITQADLNWNAQAGKIEIRDANGNVTKTFADGTATLTGDDLKNAYFVPNHNYSDADVKMGYTLSDGKNTTSGTFPIIIDAVAQMPTAVDYDTTIANDTEKYGTWQTKVDYGNDGHGHDYEAMGTTGNGGNEGTVKITVGGGSLDKDGSEQRYALLEDTGEFTIKSPSTAGTIYLYETEKDSSGKTWIKIPIPQGQTSVDIELQLKNPSSGEHVIRTGIMTEEQNAGKPGDYEVDAKNNIAYDLSGTTVINVSTVDSSASVTINGATDENVGFDLVIKGECSKTDTFNGLTIEHSGSGTIAFSGANTALYNGMWTYTGGKLTITDPVLLKALNDGTVKFSFTPNPYDDADVSWKWNSSFTDKLSGDTTGPSGSKTTVVDAVAQAPDVDHTGFGSADGTHEAAMRSGEAVIKSTVTFKDLDSSESHYIVLEQDGDWSCTGVTVNGTFYGPDKLTTMFSENGTPYYALKVTNAMLNNGSADVQFHLNAPDKNSDVGGSLKIGGISVEETTGAGANKETDLTNNWSEKLETVPVGMAIVETDKVDLGTTGTLTEDDATGVTLSLNGVKVQDANNDGANDEIITQTTFKVDQAGTPAGTVIGKITYNGVDYPVKAGEATTIDFRPNGFDKNADFRFVLDANNHNNGAVTIKTESTVVDTKSGDSKTFTDTDTINVVATADAPTNIEVTDPTYTAGTTAVGANTTVTFTVSAKFADTDGSEKHYILVEKQTGWTGNYTVVTVNNVDYFQIPVSSTNPNPTVTITLKTPANATDSSVNLAVGGMAVENSNGNTKHTFEGDDVTVNIGVVDTTAVTGSGYGTEDGAATITLSVNGINDSISKVVFTAPASGEIWYNGAAVTAVNGKVTIDNFDATKGLEYRPAANWSGDVNLSYTATVKDDASGVTKAISGTANVTIAPVTDTPVDQAGVVDEPVTQAGHMASIHVALTADFVDTDGSETHFFLVKLPAGAIPPDGWVPVADISLLDAAGMTGDVYRVDADQNGKGGFDLTVPAHYTGGTLEFMAGSCETHLMGDYQNYRFSGPEDVTIAPTGAINIAPDADISTAVLNDLVVSANGTVAVTDKDGDEWSVTKVSFAGQDHDVPTTGSLELVGDHGTLSIDATGAYTYTLHPGVVATDVNAMESFGYTVKDTHGGEATSSIDVTVGTPPAAAISGFSAPIDIDAVFDAVGATPHHDSTAAHAPVPAVVGAGADTSQLGALPDLPPITEEHKADTM